MFSKLSLNDFRGAKTAEREVESVELRMPAGAKHKVKQFEKAMRSEEQLIRKPFAYHQKSHTATLMMKSAFKLES